MKMLFAALVLLAGCAVNQGTIVSPLPQRIVQRSFSNGQDLSVVSPPPSFATVKVSWPPSPDASATSYTLYFGPGSRSYTSAIPTSTNSIIVSGLTFGAEYFLAVTASDVFGTESDFSAELAYVVPPPGGWLLARFNFPVPIGSLTNIYMQASDLTDAWTACDQCYSVATNAANNEITWLVPLDPSTPREFFRASGQGVGQ
jgi:hypothetical protein